MLNQPPLSAMLQDDDSTKNPDNIWDRLKVTFTQQSEEEIKAQRDAEDKKSVG